MITSIAILIYSVWRALNIQQDYFKNNRMTLGTVWNILFSVFMCYWLLFPSILFLFAKIIEGIFALVLGSYLFVTPGPEDFKKDRGKVINNYWGYALTDMGICVLCFLLSLLGVSNG
jgi:hypothetical protein